MDGLQMPRSRSGSQQYGQTLRFKGVRQRAWGAWVTEVREPLTKKRVWLGSYTTGEEAARVYDTALLLLQSPPTCRLNFPHDLRPVTIPSQIAEALVEAAQGGIRARQGNGADSDGAPKEKGRVSFRSEWVEMHVVGSHVSMREVEEPAAKLTGIRLPGTRSVATSIRSPGSGISRSGSDSFAESKPPGHPGLLTPGPALSGCQSLPGGASPGSRQAQTTVGNGIPPALAANALAAAARRSAQLQPYRPVISDAPCAPEPQLPRANSAPLPPTTSHSTPLQPHSVTTVVSDIPSQHAVVTVSVPIMGMPPGGGLQNHTGHSESMARSKSDGGHSKYPQTRKAPISGQDSPSGRKGTPSDSPASGYLERGSPSALVSSRAAAAAPSISPRQVAVTNGSTTYHSGSCCLDPAAATALSSGNAKAVLRTAELHTAELPLHAGASSTAMTPTPPHSSLLDSPTPPHCLQPQRQHEAPARGAVPLQRQGAHAPASTGPPTTGSSSLPAYRPAGPSASLPAGSPASTGAGSPAGAGHATTLSAGTGARPCGCTCQLWPPTQSGLHAPPAMLAQSGPQMHAPPAMLAKEYPHSGSFPAHFGTPSPTFSSTAPSKTEADFGSLFQTTPGTHLNNIGSGEVSVAAGMAAAQPCLAGGAGGGSGFRPLAPAPTWQAGCAGAIPAQQYHTAVPATQPQRGGFPQATEFLAQQQARDWELHSAAKTPSAACFPPMALVPAAVTGAEAAEAAAMHAPLVAAHTSSSSTSFFLPPLNPEVLAPLHALPSLASGGADLFDDVAGPFDGEEASGSRVSAAGGSSGVPAAGDVLLNASAASEGAAEISNTSASSSPGQSKKVQKVVIGGRVYSLPGSPGGAEGDETECCSSGKRDQSLTGRLEELVTRKRKMFSL